MHWLGIVFFVIFSLGLLSAHASELSGPLASPLEIERARKRLYPGGRDEEDLKVLATLPEALRKQDERSVQREVYQDIFKQEMVDDAPVEEE